MLTIAFNRSFAVSGVQYCTMYNIVYDVLS